MVADARSPGERGTIPPVRRLVRWTLVTLGIVAFVRWLRRRREDAAPITEQESDPAAELRLKLAESRDTAEPAPAGNDTETATGSVEERRAAVHAHGRSALTEMAPTDES